MRGERFLGLRDRGTVGLWDWRDSVRKYPSTQMHKCPRNHIPRPAADSRQPIADSQVPTVLILLAALIQLFTVCAASGAQNLATQLQPLMESHRGKVAVAIKNLETGEAFEFQADAPMPTASLIKFPLMAAAYHAVERREISLDTMLELHEEDKVPGSGILTPNFSAGTRLSLRDAIHLMIVYSDNTATNLVIDQVGLRATANLMDSLDCPHTKLHSKVFRRDSSIFPARSQKFGLGSTSAGEMVRLLEQVHAGKLVSPQASEQMYAHLLSCSDRSKLPRKLPPEIEVAHKTGSVSNVRTDAAIVESPSGPFAICVLTADNEDRSWGDDNEAELLCGEIAYIAYRHFNPSGTAPAPTIARVLKMGASGELVEALQRTLNARLEPSPQLSVDGDFGPNTESAVVSFQKEHALDMDGQVDPEFWRALGPLVTDEETVPDPVEVNAAVVERSPPDPLIGRPFVTCKSWAIADGKSGKLLWGENQSATRDPASTTKIMTAYVALKLAEQDPSVLDETVTFSQRADDTPGSTSAVRAGEQLTVGELLYGLLLPSGNDASVALAEHFGPRLKPEDVTKVQSEDPYDWFVAKMNRNAHKLGMQETLFKNTHGLTEKGHQTSARDMAKLAHAAWQLPAFRKYVGTSQHGCTVTSLAGYERNVLWRNTNRLLGTKGYDGVKTGTTGPAGACLVSHGTRGDDALIVVVLGSSSSDARYADSRNLYRWAWLELGHGREHQASPSETAKATP